MHHPCARIVKNEIFSGPSPRVVHLAICTAHRSTRWVQGLAAFWNAELLRCAGLVKLADATLD